MSISESKNGHTALLANAGSNSVSLAGRCERLIVGATDGIWVLARDAAGDWGLEARALEGTFVSSLTRTSDGAVIAGTHHFGVARSDDDGISWRWINNGLTQFDVWVVKADYLAEREVLFAGTMPAHLFMSSDGGQNWRELTAMREVPSASQWLFPPPPHLGHVKDVLVHQRELIVGIEVGALLKSLDGGQSFMEVAIDPDVGEVDIHRVLVHPDKPRQIILVTGWGLKRSRDAGNSWEALDAIGINYPDAMVVHPGDPDLLFVGGAQGYPPNWYEINRARPRLARSKDGGETWERLLGGFPSVQRPAIGGMTIAATKEGDSIFVADTDGQVFESNDLGDSWQIIFETGGVSKGEQYRGLVKGRTKVADLDNLAFSAAGQQRVDSTKA